MLRPAPLAVIVIAHDSLVDRSDALDQFVRQLYRDPDVPFSPSAGVPVVAGNLARDGTLASALLGPERRAALVLLDEHAITDASFVLALDRLVAAATPDVLRVFAVPLVANAFRVPSAVVQTNFLRFDSTPRDARWRRIGSGLVQELCRWLQGRTRASALAETSTASEAPITVFLSHAKTDGAIIAQEFQTYLQQQTRLNTFFDVHDIPPGFPFAREIEDRIGESILLVIRTDAYGTREWCQREVLAAKRVGVPVVVVDALESSERRSFPYLGNVPTIRHRAGDADRHERVLDLLLDETLRQLHFRVRVDRVIAGSRSKPVVLGSAPELVRFALAREHERRTGTKPRRRHRHVVYPDPPLSGPEADVLAHDAEAIRADSLTQFVVRRAARLAGALVAISASEADDPAERGLSHLHQRDLIVELARHFFAVGARLAYGGDFRKAGFADLLVDVARAYVRFGGPASPSIASYVPEPLTTDGRASYIDVVTFVEISDPSDDDVVSKEYRRALRLRAMRQQVASDAIALVAVGGRNSGFAGWRPGIAEEIATAVAIGRPVYLVGGFGGAAGEYARAVFLRGPTPCAVSTLDLGTEPTGVLALPLPGLVIRSLRKARNNGLSKAENVRLAETIDTDEIVGLVLAGLAAVTKPSGAA